MTLFYDTFATAVGEFSLAVNETGAVAATAFGNAARLQSRAPTCEFKRDPQRTAKARAQVVAFLRSERRTFDLPLSPRGTAFQQRVWRALSAIPFGETRTYGQLARALGNPNASRAVGRANATNPICLIVPCHRVIGADGSLTGFAFGEDIKRRLLEHERAGAASVAAA